MALPGPVILGEDFEDDAYLFQLTLKRAGETTEIKVLTEASEIAAYVKGEGVYAQRDLFPVPRIIFLDGMLHHESSCGLVKLIREHPETKDVPIFILSGSLDLKVCEEAKRAGAVDCFEKPFTREDLRRVYEVAGK